LMFVTCSKVTFEGTGLTWLEGLPELRQVTLDGTNNPSNSALVPSKLPNLDTLFVHGTGFTDENLADIGKSQSLTSLMLSYEKLTPAILAYLRGMPRLSHLMVSFWTRTDDGKFRRPTAQELVAARDQFEHLATLKNLKKLQLGGNLITDETIEPLAT